jgi:hypothetical protein
LIATFVATFIVCPVRCSRNIKAVVALVPSACIRDNIATILSSRILPGSHAVESQRVFRVAKSNPAATFTAAPAAKSRNRR